MRFFISDAVTAVGDSLDGNTLIDHGNKGRPDSILPYNDDGTWTEDDAQPIDSGSREYLDQEYTDDLSVVLQVLTQAMNGPPRFLPPCPGVP